VYDGRARVVSGQVRNVVVQEFVTLDGFAAGPNGELEFIQGSTDVDATAGEAVEAQLRFVETIDTILLGAVTYRMFAEYWPEQTTDTELIADALNRTPKVVFSQTLEEAPWGGWEPARIVRGSAEEEVRRLKQEPGKDMVVWGSLSLAQSLLTDGLVDELRLWLCPILLGAGTRLFPEGIDTRAMTWVEAKPYEGGVVAVTVRPSAS
jgi:dihydrofolate reductase